MCGLYLLCFVAAIVFSATPCAFADIIVGTNPTDYWWRNWSTADLSENGNPYWDGDSSDPAYGYNIGFYLSNWGYFSGQTAGPGAIPYWGTSTGGYDSNFYFQKNRVSDDAVMMLEVAGYSGSNAFGWYNKATGERHELFSGTAFPAPAATITFTPSAYYGFYLYSPDGGGRYFLTESSKNSFNDGFQHFAVFSDTSSTNSEIYWIGMEDLTSGGDKDYNDMVVKILPGARRSQQPVPEPATMLLLGSGLVGVGVFARRKFGKKS